jgi:hypothetical protein
MHEQCPKTEAEREEMKRYPYAKVVGKVVYAYLVSFTQLGFAIRTLSQFMHNPGKAHWEAAKRVLRYLKGARESCLVLGGTVTGLMGYADSDYASQADRHSISGYAFFLGGGAISWSSKRQSVIALSSTEAEYISLANATREAVWLRNLLGDVLRQSRGEIACEGQYQSSTNKTYRRTISLYPGSRRIPQDNCHSCVHGGHDCRHPHEATRSGQVQQILQNAGTPIVSRGSVEVLGERDLRCHRN